jgi:hypothetical protein
MLGEAEPIIIPSSEGVRQGDPLGPLLFSVAIRSKIAQLQQEGASEADDIVTAYLDDITILSSRGDLLPRIEELFSPRPGADRPPDGLILNMTKTKVTQMSELIESDVGLPLLGSLIGNTAARRSFFQEKLEEQRSSLLKLRFLPRQQGLLLMRLCHLPELHHLLRTMEMSDLVEDLKAVDCTVLDNLDFFRQAPVVVRQEDDNDTGNDASRDPTIERIATLPLLYGGFGLTSYVATRQAAREACRDAALLQLVRMGIPHAALQLQADQENLEIPLTQKQRLKMVYDREQEELLAALTPEQRLVFVDNASKCGTAWLHAVPSGKYHRLQDSEVSSAINIRLLLPDLRNRPICRQCGQHNQQLHFENCPAVRRSKKYRHDYVRDRLADALAADRWIEKEPLVAHNNLRRADLKIGAAAEGLALDPQYGLIDLKVKNILSQDTQAARAAVALAQREDDLLVENFAATMPLKRLCQAQIAASLGIAEQECLASYAPLQLAQQVLPVVLSSGGTLDKHFHELVRHLIPESSKRSRLIMDISLCLVRTRAQTYDMVW